MEWTRSDAAAALMAYIRTDATTADDATTAAADDPRADGINVSNVVAISFCTGKSMDGQSAWSQEI